MVSGSSRVAVVLALLAFVSACGSIGIETKKIDYKSAGKAPTLETPPDLVAPARDDRFAVPDVPMNARRRARRPGAAIFFLPSRKRRSNAQGTSAGW